MKLTDAQKFELFKAVTAAVAGRPQWPDITPPNKEGESKNVSKPFGAAVWAMALTRAAINVHDSDDEYQRKGASNGDSGGSETTPF